GADAARRHGRGSGAGDRLAAVARGRLHHHVLPRSLRRPLMTATIHWEDLQAGSVRELGTTSVTVDEIKEFAGKYDPQPFHLDEEAGRRSLFGGLCASGWHTCALAMR